MKQDSSLFDKKETIKVSFPFTVTPEVVNKLIKQKLFYAWICNTSTYYIVYFWVSASQLYPYQTIKKFYLEYFVTTPYYDAE